jgi:hypothetical protein
MLLPDETLPELDGVLAANLEESARENGKGDMEAVSELIERYATAAISARVQRTYESRGAGKWACRIQSSLLAYFLRTNPETGRVLLETALAARSKGMSGCYATTLKEIAELDMTPEIESAAYEVLEEDNAQLVAQAAEVLKEFGSAKAEARLWQRLERWHEQAKDKAIQLKTVLPGVPEPGAQSVNGDAMIEQSLQAALRSAQAWLLTPEELKRLRELCFTDNSQREIDQAINDWNFEIRVQLPSSDDFPASFWVGPTQLKSLDALKKKLLQYPEGTSFTLVENYAPNEDARKQVALDLKSYLEAHKMKLERPSQAQEKP